MTGKQAQLNQIRSDAAECLLVSSLTTSDKREMFAKIAEHLNSLAFEFEKTMVVNGANVTSAKQPQLEEIRSDAAECLLLSNLATSDKREMFAKTAEHLNNLAFEVEKTMAVNGANVRSAEHHAAAVMTDLTAARNQVVVTTNAAAANHQQAARSRRILSWLLVIVAVPIVGVFFWKNDHVEKYLSLLTLQSKQEQSLVPQDNAKPAGLPSSEQGERNVVAERPGVLAAPEKTLKNLERLHTKSVGLSNKDSSGVEEKIAALTRDLATARRDLETKAALSSKAADETAQLRKSAGAATAELQQERQKTAALTSELATARRDFETKLASSSKAADEAAQLKKSAEAATTELQQERQKTAALTSELASARRDFETKLASSSKAADEAAQLKKSAEAATTELQQERQKTAALTSELASARRDFETKLALSSKAADEAAQLRKSAELRPRTAAGAPKDRCADERTGHRAPRLRDKAGVIEQGGRRGGPAQKVSGSCDRGTAAGTSKDRCADERTGHRAPRLRDKAGVIEQGGRRGGPAQKVSGSCDH